MLVLLNKTDLKSVIEKETAEKLLPGAKIKLMIWIKKENL